jgi:uncharacterized membrane protein
VSVKQASVAGWTGLLAILVSGTVAVLILYRATAERDNGAVMSLDSLGWAVLISAIACMSISVALTIYARFLRVSIIKGLSGQSAQAGPPRPTPSDQEDVETEIGERFDPDQLPDDERRLYEIIEAEGGEILQVKLVADGEFSKSKVTRLLDKLEDRGLIKRERHGMTNRVRLDR